MHNQNKFQKFPIQAITYSLGSITVAIGLFVLIGWQFDIGILKSIIPNAVPMRANAAAAFVLSGLALIFLQKSGHISRALVRFLAAIVLIVGFLTCCEYLVGWDLGIDEILFSVPADIIGTPYPSRMAPTAALNFMLLGFAFIVITFKKYLNRFIVLFSVTFSITVSVIGLVGYATGLLQMTEIGAYDYTKMAVHAASAFIILSIGILLTDYKRQRAPITIDQKLFAGLTSIATIIIFISILSVSSIQSLLQASEWVKNTQEVRNQIGAVLSHVIEVQSGDRGFVLTGDDNYLVAHNKALDELPTLMNNIRSQTADNPRQQKILASLEKLVGERMALSKRRIFTRRTEGEAKARLLYPIGIAKMITDSIRVIVAQMLAEEGRLMQTRSENETHLANRNQLIIYVSIGAQVLLLVFIFFVVRRDVVGRKKAEEKLRKLNEELEDRVKERTAELAKSEERYRSTLENLMEGCQIIDFDYRYKYVNDAATKQGRTSKEDLLDHTMMEKYPGIEKSEMFDKLRKCMIERVRQGMENEFIYPDGSKAWFDLHMEPVPEGAFILSIDITER
ncbi:MAG: CHASE3 domain-containing protein, partial [Bacteroidales bacterium]|nr:CHASE3 domain-containing protein [Bacteroidales bacterium]